MSDKKQMTAVNWLYQVLFPKQLDGFSDEEWNKINIAFIQALKLEREQIVEAYNNGMDYNADLLRSTYKGLPSKGSDYYTSTYGEKGDGK